MSIISPLKGADISSNNPRISIPELVQKNYHYLALRVTGGWDGRNGPFMDGDYRVRQGQLNKQPSLVQIVYGFPIADAYSDLDTQIDRFVHTVGNFDDRIPAIDYEKYTPEPRATASPAEVRYYTRGIQKLIGPMPTLMYAGLLFWTEAPSSGDLDRYGAHIKQWVPKYRTISTLDADPRTHYLKWLAVMGWWKKFGNRDDGARPEVAQIGIFNEAGGPLDVNMARVSKDTLRKWQHWT